MRPGSWPEDGSSTMTRVIFRRDLSSGWMTSQDGIYQYGVARHGAIVVRSVPCNCLATVLA